MKYTSPENIPPGLPSDAAVRYDKFFGPLYFEPFALEVAKRIDPAQVHRVLELAAGTGRVTSHIRDRIHSSATLIASDIDEDMMAVARNKPGYTDIEWKVIDAQHIPFDDNSFDLVVCCFGYMFVADKPKAFAEAYRVLKPGGRFLITTWDILENNAPSWVARSVAKQYLNKPLPTSHDIPTSMSDEAHIAALLSDAGFLQPSIEKVQLITTAANARDVAAGLVDAGSTFENIRKQHPGSVDEIKYKVEKELGDKFGYSPMLAPVSALISEARK